MYRQMQCIAMLQRGRNNALVQVDGVHHIYVTVCNCASHIWASTEQGKGQVWNNGPPQARRCNTTEQWLGAMPQEHTYEVMNARLGWMVTPGERYAADIRYCLHHYIVDQYAWCICICTMQHCKMSARLGWM